MRSLADATMGVIIDGMLLAMALKLVISAFPEGGTIPSKYTCDGQNISPAVAWSGAPSQAKSFALILDDPDAPVGLFTHWLLHNVPHRYTRSKKVIDRRDPSPAARMTSANEVTAALA